jgi:ABC-type multidrug transport system fused ATPase/permease subunit
MKKRNSLQIMFQLAGLIKGLTGYMLLAISMGTIGHLCATFIPVLGVVALLTILNEIHIFSITTLFILLIICGILRGALRYGEQACNHYIAFKLLTIIRDKVFVALRKLCTAKLEGKDKGNLISIITSDIELLEVFYAHTISPIMIAILFGIIMCTFIGSFDLVLAMVMLISYIIVGCIIPILISRSNRDYGLIFRTKTGNLSSFVLDSLRGVNETIQYDDGKNRLNKIKEKTDSLSIEEGKMKDITGTNMAITNTVILLADLAMLFVSIHFYTNLQITFAQLVISVVALMSSFGPFVALANLGSTLQNTFAAGNRVLDILEETPVVEDIHGQKEIQFNDASVNNVSFSYDKELILDNISLTIPKGKIIGITGRSGSGKSTLLKLMMRFWKVDQGKINISNTSIEHINTDNLRNMESFVSQQTHLFHDSIANNLRIAKLDASDEELIEACKKASVHDFIMSLPHGYDTMVEELGDSLSGGEIQRIGLARAFLHDAPFMLLDEPTSNLDSLNEAVILRSLHKEHKNKSVVLVSHRQSTMNIADQVYSVENGRMS